jgi:hypothetical protein
VALGLDMFGYWIRAAEDLGAADHYVHGYGQPGLAYDKSVYQD